MVPLPLHPVPFPVPAAQLTWLLNSVTRCMLCVRRKLDRSPWSRPRSSSTGKSARPSSNWTTPGGSVGAIVLSLTPALAQTHLLEKDHSVLGKAELLKKPRTISEAKGHVQSILGQSQEGGHVLILQVLRGPSL